MSLVFVNNSTETFTPTQSGAIATFLWSLCQSAFREGIEPLVISRPASAPPFPWKRLLLLNYPSEPKSKAGEIFWRGERRITGWRYLHQRHYAHAVARAIGGLAIRQPTLFLSNDPEMAVFLQKAFPLARIVHCFHNQHGCKPHYRNRLGAAVDAVATVSDFTRDWIADHYHLPRAGIKTIHNGVDFEQFSPAPAPPPGLPVINFVGRTGIEKGPDILLDAALRLAQRTNQFSLQLLGSNHWGRFEMDDYQRLLGDRVQQLESRGIRVRRPGHVARCDLPAELRKAHIHVVPARWDEPFGLTTLEGMATGLATVASRTGGTPEVVGDAAMLFERESVEELADNLEQLARDEKLRIEQGRRARRRAEEFSWDRCWRGYRAVFESPPV